MWAKGTVLTKDAMPLSLGHLDFALDTKVGIMT